MTGRPGSARSAARSFDTTTSLTRLFALPNAVAHPPVVREPVFSGLIFLDSSVPRQGPLVGEYATFLVPTLAICAHFNGFPRESVRLPGLQRHDLCPPLRPRRTVCHGDARRCFAMKGCRDEEESSHASQVG